MAFVITVWVDDESVVEFAEYLVDHNLRFKIKAIETVAKPVPSANPIPAVAKREDRPFELLPLPTSKADVVYLAKWYNTSTPVVKTLLKAVGEDDLQDVLEIRGILVYINSETSVVQITAEDLAEAYAKCDGDLDILEEAAQEAVNSLNELRHKKRRYLTGKDISRKLLEAIDNMRQEDSPEIDWDDPESYDYEDD